MGNYINNRNHVRDESVFCREFALYEPGLTSQPASTPTQDTASPPFGRNLSQITKSPTETFHHRSRQPHHFQHRSVLPEDDFIYLFDERHIKTYIRT